MKINFLLRHVRIVEVEEKPFVLQFEIKKEENLRVKIPMQLHPHAHLEIEEPLARVARVISPLTSRFKSYRQRLSIVWNDSLFVISSGNKTAPITAAGLVSAERGIEWNTAATVGVLTILLVLVFAIFVQRYLARGLTLGAVK